MKKQCLAILSILLLAGAWLVVEAREFRPFRPIRAKITGPPGAEEVKEIQPIAAPTVKQAVSEVMSSWNTNEFSQKLGDELYDKTRLLENIEEKVPRDAKINVLGVQNVQTIGQFIQPDPAGREIDVVTSTVSAVVRSQIEFNDSNQGFRRIDGLNEFVLKITEEVER